MPETTTFSQLLATPELAELGPGPRRGVQRVSELNATIDRLLRPMGGAGHESQLIRAVILLWHDHLDHAHQIAQSIANADGAFVHGIMHRREPDYGNAAYWFRRVGKHAAFAEITGRALPLANPTASREFRPAWIRNGDWDPLGFIDACEQAAKSTCLKEQTELMRQIQRIESEVLLDFFCGKADSR